MTAPSDVNRENTEYRGYDITVTTERLRDGAWAAVARAVRHTPTAEDIFPVPVPEARFPTEEQAREFAIDAARHWIDADAPPP